MEPVVEAARGAPDPIRVTLAVLKEYNGVYGRQSGRHPPRKMRSAIFRAKRAANGTLFWQQRSPRPRSDCIFTTPDGKVLDANATYFNMIGYTREEFASRDSAHFTHPDDILPTRQFFASLQNPSHPAAIFEKRYIHKDGHTVWARVSATMRHDGAGRPTQLVAIIEDVTERKRDEAALAEKARLAALGADVGAALTRIAALPDSLRRLAEAMVKNLGASLARIWTLDPGEDTLQLQASAGLYTHLDGAHSRILVGALKRSG